MLKVRFMRDPRTALTEFGFDDLDGFDVNVAENSCSCIS